MTAPKLFISYCWSSPEHEEWVLRLGTELRENGVDVILDKWDLKEGNDANSFMEKMVSDEEIKKVILVIDEQYSDKANKRSGGVGTETQIISAEVYESVDQNKFVAVIAAKDAEGKPKLPVFYNSRIYIDLSDQELYGGNFEQLLRWVYDKPLNIKPELGQKPAFLNEEKSVALGTSVVFRRFVEAVKNSRPHASGALTDYFQLFSNNLERFRLALSNGDREFDQKVVENIESFLPARNELIEVFSSIAQYDLTNFSSPILHRFFESLIPYMNRPESVMRFHDWDWDNFKFIAHESFLLCIGVLLRYERYDLIDYLIKQGYFIDRDESYGVSKMCTYSVFRGHLGSLNYRNDRLSLNRMSVHADLLKERCSDSGISFNYLMQADFLLYLNDALQAFNEKRRLQWWPVTLVFKAFHGGSFEMFLRAESKSYFEKIAETLGVKSKLDLEPFIDAVNAGDVKVPRWDYEEINPSDLMNYEKLCSRA